MCNTLHTSIVFWTVGSSLCIAAVSVAFIAVRHALEKWNIL